MDKNKIIELENFIFRAQKEPVIAAGTMADIIGVLIDLKPAMIGDFSESEFKNIKIEEFEKLLDELGLERLFFERHCCFDGKEIITEDFYISKKIKLAEQTHAAFAELWVMIDDDGEKFDRRKWAKVTKKIGKLLGYPKTAVNEFIKEDDLKNKDRIERMKRNRYYAHSAKYEDREFKMYDQKLNKAISEFAPKTTSVLTGNKEKRWLV